MQNIIEYIHGSIKNYNLIEKVIVKAETDTLILCLLTMDPFFKGLVVNSNLIPYPNLLSSTEFWTDDQPYKNCRANVAHSSKSTLLARGHDQNLQEFINLIEALTTKAATTLGSFIKLTERQDITGFYSALIIAHCYKEGKGCQSDIEKSFTFVKRAIEIAEKLQSDNIMFDSSLLKKILYTWFESKKEEAALCQARVIHLEIKIELLKKGDLIEKINKFLVPKVEELRLLHLAQPNSAELENYYTKACEIRWTNDLRYYEESCNDEISNEVSLHNVLAKKQAGLKQTPVNPLSFYDALLKFCGRLELKRNYVWATKLYQLHQTISDSPQSAMKLGELAANGNLRTDDKDPIVSKFNEAKSYYERAIDEAIKEGDLATASKILQDYNQIKHNVLEANEINLSEKIKDAINAIRDIKKPKDKKLTWRIEAVLKNKKTTLETMPYKMTYELLNLMIQNSIGFEQIPELRDVFLVNNSHQKWFLLFTRLEVTAQNKDRRLELIRMAYHDMLPHLTTALELHPLQVDFRELCDIVEITERFSLYTSADPVNDQFFTALNNYVSTYIRASVLNSDSEQLRRIAEIYTPKPPTRLNNLLPDIAYWTDRMNFENKYNVNSDLGSPKAGLYEIYNLAALEKKGKKTLLFASYLDQLKLKNNPEAFLKVVQLQISKINPKTLDSVILDVGIHVIKAISCKFTPGDNVGIYSALSFELIRKLKEKMADEKEGYNELQRGIVHFFYALALLIINPDQYRDKCGSLFQLKNWQDLAKIALGLFRDKNLSFSDEVKRTVLAPIASLDNNYADLKREADQLTPKTAVTKEEPKREAPPPFNPAAFQEIVEDGSAMRPIPVPPPGPAASDAVDDASLITTLPPLPETAALQTEVENLRLLVQKLMLSDQQKSAQIASQQSELEQTKIALAAIKSENKQKDAELAKKELALKEAETKFEKSEGRRIKLEAKQALFFKMGKDFMAAFEPDDTKPAMGLTSQLQ